MKLSNQETLARMSDTQINDYMEWLEEARNAEHTGGWDHLRCQACAADNNSELVLSPELRRRDW